jgi:SET domain-containing protein
MSRPLPHEGVFVRLGVSTIHGIGVFARQTIKAGTNVFANDTRNIHWVDSSVLADPSLTEHHRQVYEDFAIRRGDQLGCPSNFNLLTVGWYVNEPRIEDEPNLIATANAELVALRDIEAGEELTIRYSGFAGIPYDD